jgi:hypothetical protein
VVKAMTKKSITEVVGTIVAELTPLTSEERQRVIQASLTLLGEAPIAHGKSVDPQSPAREGDARLPPRARIWMQQNGLSAEQLDQVFHFDNETVAVIAAEMPGRNRSEQSRNAYVLTGTAKFLATGDANFEDKEARALCESLGCYDSTNHAKYLKEKGNEFTGSKDEGWKLTAPGLKRAASLIQDLSSGG